MLEKEKDFPLISIIVPIYNTEQYLEEALLSCINQTYKNLEFICIDDGSTDNSFQILNKFSEKDNRIKIIKHTENKGCVFTKNEGANIASGEYLFFFDSDDKMLSNTLDVLYEEIRKKKVDIISCDVEFFGIRTGKMNLLLPSINNFAIANCIINSALLKKSDFVLCGGYDPNFEKGLEDYDLWLNLLFNHNKKIYRVPQVLYCYRIKSKEESRNKKYHDSHKELLDYIKIKYPKTNNYIDQKAILDNQKAILDFTKKKIKLFGIFPFIRIKNKLNLTKIYLFNCLILTIDKKKININ